MHQWQKWLINSSMLIPMGLIRSSTCAFSSLSIVIVIISVLPISIGSYANFLIHLQSTRLLAACKMFLQTLSRCWGNFSATLFMIFILSYQGTLHSATFYSVELTLTISIDYALPSSSTSKAIGINFSCFIWPYISGEMMTVSSPTPPLRSFAFSI